MAEKVKSFYCEVCGRQSRFTKQKGSGKTGTKMLGQAYKESNPLMAVTGGMFKAGGAAVGAAKSYRCATCGSKQGAKPKGRAALEATVTPPPPPPAAIPAEWYPDPHKEARLRYWDGQRWTEHTAA